MNPPVPNPHPENPQTSTESGCGILPQSVQGASRSDLHPPLITDHCSLGTSSPHSFDDMGFVDPPEMPAEPDYDGDYDYEESARERELMLDDLADYNDDFSRSNDEGWFYSDEN